jgi:hypothetical protein
MFRYDDWESVKRLDDLIVRGGTTADAITTCRTLMEEASSRGDESERVYLGGRLAELVGWKGRADEALEVYVAIWPGHLTPPLYGLQYLKLLLQLNRVDDAARVVQEMSQRLAADIGRLGRDHMVIDSMTVLIGTALLHARRGEIALVGESCEKLFALQPALPWLPYVDPSLLERLVLLRQYDLARRMVDFMESVSPNR